MSLKMYRAKLAPAKITPQEEPTKTPLANLATVVDLVSPSKKKAKKFLKESDITKHFKIAQVKKVKSKSSFILSKPINQ